MNICLKDERKVSDGRITLDERITLKIKGSVLYEAKREKSHPAAAQMGGKG